MKYRDIAGMKVNAARCDSCPFNTNGCHTVRQKVEQRVVTDASQLCHGANNVTLCRGARDHQLQIFYRLGILKEPTDKCWEETQAALKSKRKKG
mgnify:CR=1 FL=1